MVLANVLSLVLHSFGGSIDFSQETELIGLIVKLYFEICGYLRWWFGD